MSDCDIGLIGLGTMGSALALNIAEKGFQIAVWNRTSAKTDAFTKEADAEGLGKRVVPTQTLEQLVARLKPPRSIILMVPAGGPVDDQIAALRPLLDDDDLIIDAGNANFHDTNRRAEAGDGPFMGIGVSGGEEGARHGPSIMGGGDKHHWERVGHILQKIAADYQGTPCATHMGPAGAGHFVKAVHNGIEYADMQMIAEIYGILRDGMGLSAPAIGDIFAKWNEGPLQSYLIEISGTVARTHDTRSDGPLLDVIVDAAGQKGTGRWTAIEAQHLAAPVPTIEAAVMARNLSALRDARTAGEALFGAGPQPLGSNTVDIDQLEQALIAGKIMCYAQGFNMLSAASDAFDWNIPLPEVAKVWRAGCIIRSAMLDHMSAALADDPNRNLIFAPHFTDLVKAHHGALRGIVALAITHGMAVPALSTAVSWFDTMRTARGTANMIQGQRDFFGWHGFERLDDGSSGQHGPWAY